MVQMIRIIFILIYLFIIPDYCIGQQTSFELFKYANNEFEEENYIECLDKLGSLKNQLESSNAVIENLRVKCYYELGQYDKAEKSLHEFFKYKAADYLIEEMLEYAETIQNQKVKVKEQQMMQFKTASDKLFQDWESDYNSEINKIDKEIVEIQTKLKYAPFIASKKEELQNQYKLFKEVFEEGRVYKLPIPDENSTVLLVFYDERFILFKLPNKELVNRFNKNTIKYTSQDAINTLPLETTILHAKKARGSEGNKEMYFYIVDSEGPYIGGTSDEIIQRSFYKKAEYHFDFFYVFVQNSLMVALPKSKINLFTPKYATEISNPWIATGVFKKSIDTNLVGSNVLQSEIESVGFSHVPIKDFNNPVLFNFKFNTSNHINVLAPKKSISYTDGGKCCFNIRMIESSGDKGKVDGMQYFKPTNKKSYYAFMQAPDPFKLNHNLYIDEFISLLGKTNTTIKITKKEFEGLYKTFSQYHGNGAIRTFNNENYTLPYDIIKRISDGR